MGSHARHVYTAVVRPAMTYGSAVWHALKELKALPNSVKNKLSIAQKICLWNILDTYEARHKPSRLRSMSSSLITSHAASTKVKVSNAEHRLG